MKVIARTRGTRSTREATKLLIAVLTVLVVVPGLVWAGDVPDSIGTIQALLPDTASLHNKVVYVDFWASWCIPCRQSFPWMENIYERLQSEGLEVVAISVDKDHKSALKFLDDLRVNFPILFDSTGDLASRYNLEAMPSSFIYGRDGKLLHRIRGFTEDEKAGVEAMIVNALRKGGSK